MSAVLVEDVTVRFRGTTALSDVSTGFAADTITGLLGRNGAGKTTLMQLVTGHRLPTSGRVRVFGEPPFENDGVLARICFVKESQRYPDHFRVADAVDAASRLSRTGTATSPPRCWPTSTCRSAGRSRSCRGG